MGGFGETSLQRETGKEREEDPCGARWYTSTEKRSRGIAVGSYTGSPSVLQAQALPFGKPF